MWREATQSVGFSLARNESATQRQINLFHRLEGASSRNLRHQKYSFTARSTRWTSALTPKVVTGV